MFRRKKQGHWGAVVLAVLGLAACGGGSSPPQAQPGPQASDGTKATSASTSGQGLLDALIALAAPPPDRIKTGRRAAARLANQASFGASEALISQITRVGLEPWIASQFTTTGSRYTSGRGNDIHVNEDFRFCTRQPDEDLCWRDWYSSTPLVWDFYRNALTQPDQLRQRVAFALAQIFVISSREVDGTYGQRNYHNMLLDKAFTNWRDLMRGVTLSPVMGEYLDHVNNDRLRPNENFARELLQLFSIGTCELNADGTLQGGSCTPTYDNQIVRDYAYALTGWTYPVGGSNIYGCWPEGANCTWHDGEMVAVQSFHDNQPRQLLAGVSLSASRTPAQALNAVLDSLMNHASLAPHVGRQMIQHLVMSNPSPAYVQRVATAFTTGSFSTGTRSFGNGQRGDMQATVAAVLLDAEARNVRSVAEKMREPAVAMAALLRALGGQTDGDALGWWWGEEVRQHVFRSPSVFNFYPPDFPVRGTSLVGPAFGVLNANTALGMANFVNQMVFWGGVDADPTIPGATGTTLDLSAFLTDADNPAALVDRLAMLGTGGSLSSNARQQVINAVSAWTSNDSADWRLERVRTAAYLVFTSPASLVLN
jgi:uncharacterized protein (DUF1800 family)